MDAFARLITILSAGLMEELTVTIVPSNVNADATQVSFGRLFSH